jgi:hypothetical protein
MVLTFTTFIEFCYLVRREVLDDGDIDKLNALLAKFTLEREIFRTVGVRDNFNLPRQHSLVHYPLLIREFGAPNGLCSSIMESKHIKAVKEPWRRSNKFNALSQMVLTNQRLDKLAAARVEFQVHGMLDHATVNVDPPSNTPATSADIEDNGGLDGLDILADVQLARIPSEVYFEPTYIY